MCGYKIKNNVEGIEFKCSGRFVPMKDILNNLDILSTEEYAEFKKMKASESSIIHLRKNLHDLRNDMNNFQNSIQLQMSEINDNVNKIMSLDFLDDFLAKHIKRLKQFGFLMAIVASIVYVLVKLKGG